MNSLSLDCIGKVITWARFLIDYEKCINFISYFFYVTSRFPTFKKENPTYTGTLITGIATMHKSNAVPITNKKQAIDVANMRRN